MNFFKNILLTIIISIFMVGPSIAAEKAVGYFGWHAMGKFHAMGEGGGYWVGEFSGSFENDKGEGSLFQKMSLRCPAWQSFNFVQGTTRGAGVCYGKDRDGDEMYMEWSFQDSPLGATTNGGILTYTGGTGKYADFKGDAGYFIGHVVTNWADGDAGGYALWNKEQ